MFGKKEKVLYEFDIANEYKYYEAICEKNPDLSKYDSWEKHILPYLGKMEFASHRNLKNFKHYIINEKHKVECDLKERETISVPVNIGFIGFYMTFVVTLMSIRLDAGTNTEADYNYLGVVFLLITIVMAAVYFIAMYMYQPNKMKKLLNKIAFYNDIINIIDNYKAEKS